MNDSNDIRDLYPDRKTTGFLARWWFWTLGLVVLASIVVGVLNFAGNWASQPAKIYGVENVREQWRFAYTYNAQLGTIQRQYCTAKRAVDDAVDDVERTQRVTQRIAVENNYDRVRAQYDARLQNAFEAKLVRPSDVPKEAPALDVNCL